MTAKPKGKSKTPPNTEERATIVTLAASGASSAKIAKLISRSRGMVKNVLAKPEIQRAVQDERAVLAELYRDKARRIVDSISEEDIAKASLQQKSISSGVLLDKSLLLSGEPTSINISVLLDAVQAAKALDDKRSASATAAVRLRMAAEALALPAPNKPA